MNSSVRCHSNIDFVLHGESNIDFMTLATPNVQKRGVFVDACWSVSPLCGFSLSLFCNYKAASSRGCGTVTEPRHPPEQPQHAYGLIEQTLLSLHCVSSQKSTVVLLCTCGMWSRIDDHCDRLVMLEVLEASGLHVITCCSTLHARMGKQFHVTRMHAHPTLNILVSFAALWFYPLTLFKEAFVTPLDKFRCCFRGPGVDVVTQNADGCSNWLHGIL